MKNTKVANVNVDLKGLFLKWLEITRAFHGLTPQQQSVLSLFLYYHYKFKKEITNNKILWKLVFDYETKRLIKEELGVKDSVLQNILTTFRKQNIIIDGKINPLYIPELEEDAKDFKVIFYFNIVHE